MSASITFCIPTLNRVKEIEVCLTSIISQAGDDVEIVVLDGGSTDGTAELVGSFSEKYTNIKLFTSSSKAGVDRDILEAVSHASGRFCWLFSDDDYLLSGAYAQVCNRLAADPDAVGITTNYQAYDSQLKFKIRTVPALASGRLDSDLVFSSIDDLFLSLALHLGFISCQIVRTDVWNRVAEKGVESKHFNSWIIIHMIGRCIQQGGHWIYLSTPCVGYRSGNDSFLSRLGIIRRQEITHVHFANTISYFFGKDSGVFRAVLKSLLTNRMPRTLALLKSRGLSLRDHLLLFRLYSSTYHTFPQFWLLVLPVMLVPNFLFTLLRQLYFNSVRR